MLGPWTLSLLSVLLLIGDIVHASCVEDRRPPQRFTSAYVGGNPFYDPSRCPAFYNANTGFRDGLFRSCRGWNSIYTAPGQLTGPGTLVRRYFDLQAATTGNCMGPVTVTTSRVKAKSVELSASMSATLEAKDVASISASIAATMGVATEVGVEYTFAACKPAYGYFCRPLVVMEGRRYWVQSRRIAWQYIFAGPAKASCTSQILSSSVIRWQRSTYRVLSCYWRAGTSQPANLQAWSCVALTSLARQVAMCERFKTAEVNGNVTGTASRVVTGSAPLS
jgi:hypothetical protein